MIETVIRQKLEKFINKQDNNTTNKEKTLTVYHCVNFSSSFEEEAEAVRKIVARGATANEPYDTISLRVFCRSPKVSALIMKNSTAKKNGGIEKETNVIYHFKCSVDACQQRNSDYIGLTTQTLRKRLAQHRNNGAINAHYTSVHDRLPRIDELLNSTKVIHRESLKPRLFIAEAVSIALRRPTLNVQTEFDYVLPSCRSRPVRENGEGARGNVETRMDNVEREENTPAARGAQHVRPLRPLRPLPHRVKRNAVQN